MLASIFKRNDGLWQGSIIIKDLTGKSIRKTVYGKTKKEVQQKLLEIQSFPNLQKLTLKEWSEIWLEKYAPFLLTQTTLESYKRFINNHILPNLGHMYLFDIKPLHIQDLIKQKSEKGRADGKNGGLSKRSLKYIQQILNNIFKQAVKEGFISSNPAQDVKICYNYMENNVHVLTKEQVQKFLETAKSSQYYIAYLIELTTGLRRGEILGLKWSDINWEQSSITIKREVVLINGKPVLQERVKTNTSYRTLFISPEILELLKQLPKTSEFIFTTRNKTLINPRNFIRDFKNILKKAGLPQAIRFHDLRHTYATLLLQSGLSLKYIQQDLGHSKASFTLQRYSHVTTDYNSEVLSIKNNILKTLQHND